MEDGQSYDELKDLVDDCEQTLARAARARLEKGLEDGEAWATWYVQAAQDEHRNERTAGDHKAEPPDFVLQDDDSEESVNVEEWQDYHDLERKPQQQRPLEEPRPQNAYDPWHFIEQTAQDAVENSGGLWDVISVLTEKKVRGFSLDRPKKAGPLYALMGDFFARGYQQSLTLVDRPHAVTVDQWLVETTMPDAERDANALVYYNAARRRAGLKPAGLRQFRRDLDYAKGTITNYAKFGRLPNN